MAKQTPSQQLYDLLVTKNFDPELLDSSGRPSSDPSDADIFSFDYVAESGNDYGTVVIMLGGDNNLDVFSADNIGRGMEEADKNSWFEFLHEIKQFATRNFLDFSTKNLNRLRYSMQGQAAIKEGLFESWAGKRDISWNANANESRLVIKHNRNLGEGEARFRYIESLFIETADGERYKLPFKNLTAGKAMLEHVRLGGKPYDMRGQHIAEIVTELTVLSRFKRANQGQLLEGDTATLVEQATTYFENTRRTLKSLSTPTGYNKYFESWTPAEITEQEVVIEGIKHLFVTQSIDQRIEDALPLIARIQQQGTTMKEANIFEAWANQLMEGTWQLPDTPEKQSQLVKLLSTDLPVGADATNATEQLYDLIGDDELFDQLEALADRDANADARQVVYDRLQMLSDNPDVKSVIDQLQINTTAEMNPPEATPADLAESRLMDDTGETIDHILNRFKYEVKTFEQGGNLDQDLYEALFDYWDDAGEIPYGIAKARTGDPYEWVATNLESHLGGGGIVGGNPDEDQGVERESIEHGDYAEEYKDPRTQTEDPAGTTQPVYPEYQDDLAGILRTAGVPAQERTAPDYETGVSEEQTDEGVLGSLAGAAIGALTPIPGGATIGSIAGDAIQDKLSDKEETDESSPLAGKYGHSGKMKEVSKDLSFLDRLKELSGMKK